MVVEAFVVSYQYAWLLRVHSDVMMVTSQREGTAAIDACDGALWGK